MKNKNYAVNSILKIKKWKYWRGENNVLICIWERQRWWGKGKKVFPWPLLLSHGIESQLTEEEEKVGILKGISPLKSFIIQKCVQENFKLLHLFLSLLHKSLHSDLTNSSCFLTTCSTFFFHCSCKIYNSKITEALPFEGRGGGRGSHLLWSPVLQRMSSWFLAGPSLKLVNGY